MAFTATLNKKTVYGDMRVHHYVVTTDGASDEISTGLGYIDQIMWAPKSMATLAGTHPRFAANVLTAATASNGTVSITGCTSGDDYYMTLLGDNMSTIGPVKAFTATMSTGTTITSAIDLGGSFGKIMVGIPTMASGTDHYFKISDSESGTFRRLYHANDVDTAKPTVVVIDSSVTNCYVPINCSAQFLKIEATTAATAAAHTYKLICGVN